MSEVIDTWPSVTDGRDTIRLLIVSIKDPYKSGDLHRSAVIRLMGPVMGPSLALAGALPP